MRIFGHPVHMMLVHFPSALIPIELLLAILNKYMKLHCMLELSFYLIALGVIFGWLAVITGSLDLIRVQKTNPEAINRALIHGGINTVFITGYSILGLIAYKNYPLLRDENFNTIIIVKIILISFLMIGNYIGGSLILKNKVAVGDE
ncbi:MAG: DUF2231 domain-containing protein [Cytophagaceae bacterium]